jgi:hypothetical protein
MVYLPGVCRQGFLALKEYTEILEQMSQFCNADSLCGGTIQCSRLLGGVKWNWFPRGIERSLFRIALGTT